jgi:aspartyl-tRNA(Asn)/glutamyl-tRNA(Gln) amidotransferase subunit B
MPEMPQYRFARYTDEYGLPSDDANLIISSRAFSDFYDEAVKLNSDYKQISNMMLGELNRNLNDSQTTIEEVKFSPADLAKLVKMSSDGVISKNAAKDILTIMFNNGGEPESIAKEHGFIMDNDTSGLEEIINKVIADNSDSVESYKSGNQKVFGFLMGQVVKAVGKGANPKLAKDLLMEKLK